MRSAIDKVISGELARFDSILLSPKHVEEYLELLGAKDLEDRDTNGWQMDNWSYWEVNGRRYCVQGEGYGGGVQFYEEEES